MILGKSANEAAKGMALVEVNGRDYALTGYVGTAPVHGYSSYARSWVRGAVMSDPEWV